MANVPTNVLEPRKLTDAEKRKILGTSYDSAYRFATKVFEKFPGILKSIVLFGSVQKGTVTRKSDIDIAIVLDDTSVKPTRKFIDWYSLEIATIIQKSDPRIHVTTVTLTTFWENVKTGEPVAINMLRYGIPLIDTGFFEPLKYLLLAGRIKPTEEAVYNALTRAPWHRVRANSRILGAVIDFYWVMIDSAHAALMKYGQVPPSPEHIEPMLMDNFVRTKMLNSRFVKYYKELWLTSKAVVHGDLTRVGGADYDRYRRMAEEFEAEMRKLIERKSKK
jgi:predicted nucleotidyltransferase